jgi:hypothetical protein
MRTTASDWLSSIARPVIKRLAQQHCSPCHIVEPNQRQELADSPPFETIAQKYGNAPELIAYAILAPNERDALSP